MDEASNVSVARTHSFYKSTFSSTGSCVEVAFAHDDAVLVRDSKDPEGPVLSFTQTEWRVFLSGVLDGQFNLPGESAIPGAALDVGV